MAFIPTANTVEVLFAGRLLDVPANMVFHFNSLTHFNEQGANALLANLAVWVQDNALPALPDAYIYSGLFARAINTPTGFTATNIENAGLAGDDLNPVADGQSSICITTRTPFAGKSARGRKYWPGVSNFRVSNNRIDTGWLAIVRAALAELVGVGTVSTGWTWIVVSKFFNNEPRSQGATFPITSVTATSNVVASQRRRKPKRA